MTKINHYFKQSSDLILSLKSYNSELNLFVKKILDVKKNGKKILVAGNGGSCSDAEHFVGELQCTFKSRDREPISAFSITGSTAALTAWSNDFEYNSFFERQVQAHGQKGDVLVLLTTSGGQLNGSSSNVVKAAIAANKLNIPVISFVGRTGGELKKLSEICFHIENNVTSFIQEAHMSLLHCVCELLEDELKLSKS